MERGKGRVGELPYSPPLASASNATLVVSRQSFYLLTTR